jgi:hypothetical protein
MNEFQDIADQLRSSTEEVDKRKRNSEIISKQRVSEFVGIMVANNVGKIPMYNKVYDVIPATESRFTRKVTPKQTLTSYEYVTAGWLITEEDMVYPKGYSGVLINEEQSAFKTYGLEINGDRPGLPIGRLTIALSLEDISGSGFSTFDPSSAETLTRAIMRLAPGALGG